MTAAALAPLQLYTAPEAARALRIGVKQIHAAADAGELRYVLLSKQRRFKMADLEAWITAATKEAPCASIAPSARRSGNMTSRSTVIDFEALRAQRNGGRPKPPRSGSAPKP